MSLSCGEALALLREYAAEALVPDARRALRAHLAGCRACREVAAHADEGLLFAGASAEEVSSEDVNRILSGVRAGVALRQTERRLHGDRIRGSRGGVEGGPVRRSRAVAIAALARRRDEGGRRRGLLVAAAAIVVVFTLAFPGRGPQSSQAPATKASLASRGGSSPDPLVGAKRQVAPPQEIPNSKFPADATIYDWNPGSGQPRVVWIVDRSLDI